MPFPFIAPLKKELKEKFKKREILENRDLLALKMPFVMLSSPAVVMKAKPDDVKSIIKGGNWPSKNEAYWGCVVSNNTDIKHTYQSGKTIVGYDLNGKQILVEGEENRRVSTPIIQGVEIDTDGNNNTLKVAKVTLKVFTLKQLEMFELFFLRPAMDVVLEFGYSSDIRGQYYNKIERYLFAGKDYQNWENRFLEIFSHKDNAYKEAKEKYIKTLKDTDFDYDYMSGKITNFNFSPETDGTYNIMIEISSGNELQMWMPLKQASETGKISRYSGENTKPYDQWLNKLAADLNLPKLIDKGILKDEKKWKNEFFNWGVVNKDEKDTNYSKDAYISFRLILKIINASQLFSNKPEQIKPVYFEDKELTKPIMPVSSWKTLISTTPLFILPGDLPKIFVANIPKKKDQIVLDEVGKPYHCPINGYSFTFNTTESEIYSDSSRNPETKELIPLKIPPYTGNLLNVFVNYESFVQIYNQAYTQGDIINSLLSDINSNMFGLCKLELQKEDDSERRGPLTIIDRKLKNLFTTEKPEEIYRFKIGPIGSIVKEFEFNMEMSELMQGQAMFAAEYDMLKVLEEGKTDNKRITAEIEENSAADFSFLPNADGFISVNKVGVSLVKEAKEWNNILNQTLNVVPEEKREETEDEKINNHEVLTNNYIRFKPDPSNRNPDTNHMVYQDAALIQYYLPKKQKNTTVLTFLDVTIAIDGTSGLSCGEYFQLDGIPEIYNKNGYFQITNVKHALGEGEWKTVIEAQYLLKSPEVEEDDKKQYTARPAYEKAKETKSNNTGGSAFGTPETPTITLTTGVQSGTYNPTITPNTQNPVTTPELTVTPTLTTLTF
jgi:hypothetical protein